jgi:hypothetical protein
MNNEGSIEGFRITGHQAVGQKPVIMENDNLFNPRWRDDVYDEKALNIPLLLPPVSAPNNRIWVAKKVIRGEEVFGKYQEYKKSRVITAVVKKNRSHAGRKITDENGSLSIAEYEEKARELALTVKLPNLQYNRDHYFFPYAVSFPERHIIRKILSLAGRDKPGNN